MWLAAAGSWRNQNGEGRNFPLTARMRQIIQDQLDKTKALERASRRIIPWLFHRDDQTHKEFSACIVDCVQERRSSGQDTT
jgi:hypothetical protein